MIVRSGYRYVVTVEPTEEPIALAEAKVHCRVDHDDENDLITSLIVSARQWAENETRRRLVNTTLRLSMDCFPEVIRLPGGKVSSVTSITYTDTNGDSQTLSSSVYTLDSDSEPARIVQAYGQFWPAIRYVPNAVKATYVAGYGAAASNVPDGIRSAIKQHVLYSFNREPEEAILESAKALLDPFRIQEFI